MNRPRSLSSFLETQPKKAFLLLSAALIAFLYWHSLSSPFVYDDLAQIVGNPNLSEWSRFAPRFLLRPVDLTSSLLNAAGSTYRPVFWLSLFVDRKVWGLDPSGYHFTNLVLHFLNGFLAFSLLLRLRLDPKAALVGVLIWASLPIDTEVVAWVSGRAYLLCTFFIFAALVFALSFNDRGTLLSAVGLFFSSLLAVLSHELGIVLLPMLVWVGLLDRHRRKRSLSLVLACTTAVVLALGWRVHLGVRNFARLADPKWALQAFSQYLELVFFPLHMSVERSTNMTLGYLSLASLVVVSCFFIGLTYSRLRRRIEPWLFRGLAWFTLCIAPFCLVRSYQGLAERFAYLAALGIAIATVTSCLRPVRHTTRVAMLSIACIWCAWSLCRTIIRVGDWADPIRLYSASLEATPQSPSLHFNLAFSHRELGDLPEALSEYQQTLRLDPTFPHVYASLGDVYLKEDHYAEALAAYNKALTVDHNDAAALLNLGAAYQGSGDTVQAERAYQRVVQVDPKSSAAHVNLGVLFASEQRTNEAMHQFAMAIDLKSSDIVPYYNLGALLQQAGRPDLAMVLYRKALEIKPDDQDTLHNMELIEAAKR